MNHKAECNRWNTSKHSKLPWFPIARWWREVESGDCYVSSQRQEDSPRLPNTRDFPRIPDFPAFSLGIMVALHCPAQGHLSKVPDTRRFFRWWQNTWHNYGIRIPLQKPCQKILDITMELQNTWHNYGNLIGTIFATALRAWIRTFIDQHRDIHVVVILPQSRIMLWTCRYCSRPEKKDKKHIQFKSTLSPDSQ